MLYLDYLAYNNALNRVSIGEKLLLGGGSLALALALPRPVALVAVVAAMHAVMVLARIPVGYIARLWLAPCAFLAAGLAGVAVSVAAAPFAALASVEAGGFYIGVTAEGLAAAGGLLLRSVAAVSCLMMLATTTPVAYLAAWFARFPGLRPVSEIALLTYRFIFVFLTAAGQIYTAQQSRLGYAGPRRSLNSLALLAANVGRKAFLTANDLSNALAARNYQDRLTHYYPEQAANPFRLTAIVALLAVLAAAGVV
ncbi:cobalt ECF transporter T component CbiQ [Anaeroselena agilis]|uniref:Cobalt ECF transporter T component CbiQ n=1 Tax=Anaeroselena agilis TaxID=3063788 RepID=A0ABU3P3A5_9FIRM|nr:cobalt ECF transporter T component CbiQ [Selenomonadales bacterium 4137-cl]